MKNSAIEAMVRKQFNLKADDKVEVEFKYTDSESVYYVNTYIDDKLRSFKITTQINELILR